MHGTGVSSTRAWSRRALRLAVLLLASCQGEKCSKDISGICLIGCDYPSSIPKTPQVVIVTPAGRTQWDTARVGIPLQLTATLRDTLGREMTGRTFDWVTKDPTTATVGANGTVNAVGLGQVQIEATALPDRVTGSITLVTRPGTIVLLSITPATAAIPKGESRTFIARALDILGFEIPDTPIAWSSENASVATVSSTGVVSAVAEGGPVSVFAAAAGKIAVAHVTVVPAVAIHFTQLALGWRHSCGLTAEGKVYCWGANDRGQLGDSTTVGRSTIAPVLQGNLQLVELAAGGVHTCARSSAGVVYCWGGGREGALGDGDRVNDRPYPAPIASAGVAFVRVAAGAAHACALTGVGETWCWGQNPQGEIGDGTFALTRPVPTRVQQGGVSYTSISVGRYFACGLTGVGRAYCWGSNFSGQLGDSTTSNRNTPTAVLPFDASYTSIATGSEHTCAITSGNDVSCWGRLMDPSFGSSPFPAPTAIPGDRMTALASPAGLRFQCALTASRGVACWGGNESGQLGAGTTSNVSVVPNIPAFGSEPIVGVATGGVHACAWTTMGKAWCWGDNSEGQLGDGTTTRRLVPTLVKLP